MLKAPKLLLPKWMQASLIFIFGITVFIFILVNRYPVPLRPIAVQARYGLTIFAPIAFIVFFLVFRLKGFWGKLLSFSLTLGLFALALSGLWVSGNTEPQVISGLLPTVDAGEFFYDALRLLNGAQFSDFSSRRPIFSGLLSSILLLTGKDLQSTIAITVGIVAIACYLAIKNVKTFWNPLSTSIFLLFLFYFYRRFAGRLMTENLGFALGVLGFAFLINGITRKNKLIVLLSLFLLTLGLNVRAGPFFILIGFFIAANLFFKNEKKWDKYFAILLIIVILIGFFINYFIFLAIGSKTGSPFSNFSYTLYGVVNNGEGWTKIMYDHPEIFSLPEPDLNNKIYQLAFESFKAHPFGIVIGAIRQYGVLFNFYNSNISIYSYVTGGNRLIFHLIQIIIYIFALIGLIRIIKEKSQPINYFLLLILAGFFLSVPLSPPGDSSNMRIFAVSIPFIVSLPVIGFEAVTNKIPWLAYITKNKENIRNPVSEVIFSLVLVMAAIVAPLIIHSISPPLNFQQITCSTGQDLIYMDLRPNSSIRIFSESEFFLDWIPNFHKGRFVQNLHAMSVESVIQEFESLPTPVMITSGINLNDNQDMFLIIKKETDFNRIGRYAICGKRSDAPLVEYYSPFFYADTFSLIN